MTNQPTSFGTIDVDQLADVQGGCGRRRRCCCPRDVNIVNNYAAPIAAPAPTAAVDVSVGYQSA